MKRILVTICSSLSALLQSVLAGNWTVYDQYSHYYYGIWHGRSGYCTTSAATTAITTATLEVPTSLDQYGNGYYIYGN